MAPSSRKLGRGLWSAIRERWERWRQGPLGDGVRGEPGAAEVAPREPAAAEAAAHEPAAAEAAVHEADAPEPDAPEPGPPEPGPPEPASADPSPEDTAVMAVSDVIESVAAELMACIVVIYGTDLGSKHVIEKRKTTIGSAPANDIRVEQEPASKTFVVLTLGPRGVDLKNAGSGIGIWVDDEPIDGVIRLRDGNLIRVGRTIFKYLTNERSQEDGYHEAMYRLLTTDELTQAFNRSYVTDALEREIAWARRTQKPLSLVMLDVDHLKRCNDTFGQRTGDHALREVTRIVRERSRESDVVGRYRDDELAILLPGLDVQGAASFAEATREAIERHRIEHEGRHVAVTVSAGVVELELHIATGDALVDVADDRLRRAKQSGRNRIVSEDGEPTSSSSEA